MQQQVETKTKKKPVNAFWVIDWLEKRHQHRSFLSSLETYFFLFLFIRFPLLQPSPPPPPQIMSIPPLEPKEQPDVKKTGIQFDFRFYCGYTRITGFIPLFFLCFFFDPPFSFSFLVSFLLLSSFIYFCIFLVANESNRQTIDI